MSAHTSPNATFNAAANAAEAARQAAVVPGASQAAVVSAEQTYFRSVYKAAIANSLSPSVFTQALKSLGSQS